MQPGSENQPELNTHSAVDYHWRVWQLTGLIRPAGISKSLYRTYAIGLNLMVTLLFPLSLLARLILTRSMKELCENLTITITDITANLKFGNVYLVRRHLGEIRSLIQQLDCRALAICDRDELCALVQAVTTARNTFRTFAWIFVCGTSLSCVRVALARSRQLLYPAWFGVDWKNSNEAFVGIYVYQLFGLIVQAVQNCASDSYPPAYLCLLTGHMRALEVRVARIGCECASGQQSYDQLLSCIQDLTLIHRMHTIIQQILSVPCMAQFACSVAVQCTVAMHFLYVADADDRLAMILSVIFFVAVTLEVFVICYFGEKMRTQSEALCNAFYACNWVEQLPRFRRDLLFTLARAQRPSLILAGSYIPLTLETFKEVMHFAYSAFTLLLRAK
ncbi:GL13334 [Drosophila persimilis]|uniref:Odorant receptor n=1 Tax=Drosophila persimilis TaxID=7234 RepID=B4H365_DROPE|nr:odorant receptor 2a [Drosophila persimilis]EDW30758.1 GL13334 [Drosophila persimilis]